MKHLYKEYHGNQMCRLPNSEEEEKLLRADGFMLPEELWPPTPVEKPKRKVNGRNSV